MTVIFHCSSGRSLTTSGGQGSRGLSPCGSSARHRRLFATSASCDPLSFSIYPMETELRRLKVDWPSIANHRRVITTIVVLDNLIEMNSMGLRMAFIGNSYRYRFANCQGTLNSSNADLGWYQAQEVGFPIGL